MRVASLLRWELDKRRHVTQWAATDVVVDATMRLLERGRDRRSLAASPELFALRRFFAPQLEVVDGTNIFVAARDRTNLASMGDEPIGQSNLIAERREPLFERMMQGETVFVTPLRGSGSEPAMYIGTPIRDTTEGIIGVLALEMDPLETLTPVADSGRIGDTSHTYFFDSAGRLITQSRYLPQLQEIGLAGSRESGILSVDIRDPGSDLVRQGADVVAGQTRSWPFTEMADSALQGQSGSSIVGYRDLRGVPVLGTWLWDGRLNMGMATEIEEREALRPYATTRTTVVVILAITVALALAVALAIAYFRARVAVLTKLSIMDGLTGIANRRRFNELLDERWIAATRSKLAISLVILDVDHFKLYNDRYGHQAGDECLKAVASVLRNVVRRKTDLCARYGGEEFVILMPMTEASAARALVERVAASLAERRILHEASPVSQMLTLSMGLATCVPSPNSDSEQLLARADDALYKAKKAGRNRIEIAS